MPTKHTPESIRKLSDDELNRLVAREVMGWGWHEAFGSWQTGNGYVYPETWHPATTWDAGRVLERMRELGWYVEINGWQDDWDVTFNKGDEPSAIVSASECGNSIHRAISEAACLAYMKEPDDE